MPTTLVHKNVLCAAGICVFLCYIFKFHPKIHVGTGIISISLNLFVSISKRNLSVAMLKFRRAAIIWSKIGEGELCFLIPLKLRQFTPGNRWQGKD